MNKESDSGYDKAPKNLSSGEILSPGMFLIWAQPYEAIQM
uniref:Uncharacterized protein n=1 Tax=Arundo donax TaxID=35708 RepID=A0A0A9EDZ9_ARUDO